MRRGPRMPRDRQLHPVYAATTSAVLVVPGGGTRVYPEAIVRQRSVVVKKEATLCFRASRIAAARDERPMRTEQDAMR